MIDSRVGGGRGMAVGRKKSWKSFKTQTLDTRPSEI